MTTTAADRRRPDVEKTPTADAPSPIAGGSRPGGGGRVALALKAAVSLGVLGFLFAQADWRLIAARLADASLWLLALGFAVKTLTVFFAAERWRAIAAVAGSAFSHWTSVKLMMVSLLFGQVLPGALGGDLVRGWLTWRLGYSPSSVMMALVVDRLAALAGVVLLLAAGLPRLLTAAPPAVGWLLGTGLAVAAVGLAMALHLDRLPLPGFLRRSRLSPLFGAAARMRGALTWSNGGAALFHSVVVHVCTVAAAYVFACALGLSISPLDCLAVVPLTIVAAALPVSLAGWGMREGSMVAGFALFGVAADDALLISLLIGSSVLLMALPGAAVWLAWRAGPDPSSTDDARP
jgi:glycosyltransferase 2 family protein